MTKNSLYGRVPCDCGAAAAGLRLRRGRRPDTSTSTIVPDRELRITIAEFNWVPTVRGRSAHCALRRRRAVGSADRDVR